MFNTRVVCTVLILLSASGIILSIPVPHSAKSISILPSFELEDSLEELLSGITYTSPVPEDFTTELQNVPLRESADVPLCETAEQRADCEAFLEAHINNNSEAYRQLQIIKDANKRHPGSPIPLPEVTAMRGFTELLQVLLCNGVPINKKYLLDETLLHIAAEQGHYDMVTFLLSQGADIQAKDCVGISPLHKAVSLFQSKTAKLLLNAGANVNATNDLDETPLFRVVKYLTPSEYSSNLFNMEDWAEYKRRRYVIGKDIIEMLLQYGADTNIPNYLGKTPLHVASKNSNLTIVQVLIDGGANINATDDNNQTPLHVATESNNLSVVEYLATMGCDITVTDRNSKTALDIAEEKNLKEMVDLLSRES